jgi:hypothetical protein
VAISIGERIFFAAVAALALWVGTWGAFVPQHVDWALPWIVPPMHARFLGAMYLSGAVFMLGATFARRWSAIRVVVPMCAVWTGLLLVVSLLFLPEFDWRKQQVWIWFVAYAVFPLGAALIAWRHRREVGAGPGPALPALLRTYLRVQGVIVLVLAAALFFAPALMATLWPWAITTLLAQLYSAPFCSFGAGALLAARERTLYDVRLYLLATLTFAAGVLLASAVHRALFSLAQVADLLWFAGFAVASLALGAGSVLALLPAPAGDGLAPDGSALQNAPGT